MDRRWWPAVAVGAVVLVFSLVPLSAPDAGGRLVVYGVGLDKLVHVVDYAALTVALGYGVRARTPAMLLAVFLAAVAVGGVVELLQGLVPSRGASFADAVANAVGAAFGTAGWWLAGVVRRR